MGQVFRNIRTTTLEEWLKTCSNGDRLQVIKTSSADHHGDNGRGVSCHATVLKNLDSKEMFMVEFRTSEVTKGVMVPYTIATDEDWKNINEDSPDLICEYGECENIGYRIDLGAGREKIICDEHRIEKPLKPKTKKTPPLPGSCTDCHTGAPHMSTVHCFSDEDEPKRCPHCNMILNNIGEAHICHDRKVDVDDHSVVGG